MMDFGVDAELSELNTPLQGSSVSILPLLSQLDDHSDGSPVSILPPVSQFDDPSDESPVSILPPFSQLGNPSEGSSVAILPPLCQLDNHSNGSSVSVLPPLCQLDDPSDNLTTDLPFRSNVEAVSDPIDCSVGCQDKCTGCETSEEKSEKNEDGFKSAKGKEKQDTEKTPPQKNIIQTRSKSIKAVVKGNNVLNKMPDHSEGKNGSLPNGPVVYKLACDKSGSLLVLAAKLHEAEFKVHGRRSNRDPPGEAKSRWGVSKCVGPGRFRFVARQKRFTEDNDAAVDGLIRITLAGEKVDNVLQGRDLSGDRVGCNTSDLNDSRKLLQENVSEANNAYYKGIEKSLSAGRDVLGQLQAALKQKISPLGSRRNLPKYPFKKRRPSLWPVLAYTKINDESETSAFVSKNRGDFAKMCHTFKYQADLFTKELTSEEFDTVINSAVDHVMSVRRSELQRFVSTALQRNDIVLSKINAVARSWRALNGEREPMTVIEHSKKRLDGLVGEKSLNGISTNENSVDGEILNVNGELVACSEFGDSMEGGKNGVRGRFTCDQCPYCTDNRSHLIRHKNSIHTIVRPFACYVCLKPFTRLDNVRTHFRSAHPSSSYFHELVKKMSGGYKREAADEDNGNAKKAKLDDSGGKGILVTQEDKAVDDKPINKAGNSKGNGVQGTDSMKLNNNDSCVNGKSCQGMGTGVGESAKVLQFRCTLCSKSFTTCDVLEVHTATVHLKRLYVCKNKCSLRMCDFYTITEKEYSRHLFASHGLAYTTGASGEPGRLGGRESFRGPSGKGGMGTAILEGKRDAVKHGLQNGIGRRDTERGNGGIDSYSRLLMALKDKQRSMPADAAHHGLESLLVGKFDSTPGAGGSGQWTNENRSLFDALELIPTKNVAAKTVDNERAARKPQRNEFDSPAFLQHAALTNQKVAHSYVVESQGTPGMFGNYDSRLTNKLMNSKRENIDTSNFQNSKPFKSISIQSQNQMQGNVVGKQFIGAKQGSKQSASQSQGAKQSAWQSQDAKQSPGQLQGAKQSASQSQVAKQPASQSQGAKQSTGQSPSVKPKPVPRSAKSFDCPHCPERPAFCYWKSFSKHMQQHADSGILDSDPGIKSKLPIGLASSVGGGAPANQKVTPGFVQPMFVGSFDSESEESDNLEYKDDPADVDFKVKKRKH